MATTTRCLGGALLAAAAMYWFDPTSGRRRRARLRDRLVSTTRDLRHGIDVGSRDLAHRLSGMASRMRYAFEPDTVDDAVLVERVRACLGRVVSHPGAIDVEASQGRVVLSGAILADEYRQLMRTIRSVRGLKAVEDYLGVYEDRHGIPALQGGVSRQPARFELMQEHWSPATRLLASTGGAAMLLFGLRTRGPFGILGAIGGSAFLVRGLVNAPLKRLAGGSGRRAIDVHKTLHIDAPVERVFEALSRCENYPLFMHNVRKVQVHGDGRTHWTVSGPAGIPVEWDAETTHFEMNRMISWRTVRNAPVQHAGTVRFEPFNGGTRLTIQMSYNPPAGALGHVIARLFGADPKSELDQDLVRLKTFLETGKPPRDAARHATPGREPGAIEELEAGSPARAEELDGAQSLH